MPHAVIGSLCLALSISGSIAAQDWPEFRGPTGQGHSTERGLPLNWSEATNIVWKVPVVGNGWSAPAVAGGRVWLTTAVTETPAARRSPVSLRVTAFDVETGRAVIDVEALPRTSP